ncbi:PAS domain-containing protein [Promethearchaeum syntrophicum]|uniref:PAS domain-containing protein n=1 Tax=Promethearchaeum syntrophicum TaxID=2594042 RepID=A0A5B9DC18_9ARCH|nr:PAS domain-containing protein [Candidatus Prometheoarchaeum syntrophicum]QEE16581.1 PAS fold protein [Candidatus Prometheoarchaeum syntrophicum]
MEFDATLEKEAMEIIFNLIQRTSEIVLFRVYYDSGDRKSVFLDLGKTANQILGIPQRISVDEFLSLVHPDYLDDLNSTIHDLREINQVLDYEVQFFNPNIKKYIWIHILTNYLPINDKNKDKRCVIGIIEDITDIKNRESSLYLKDEQIQSYKVVSVIASMLMHKNEELTENISEILKTMGNSLKATCIAVYRDTNEISNKESENQTSYVLSDKWCIQQEDKFCKEFDNLFVNELLYELECSSMKMYTERNSDEYPSELIPLLERAKIGSFLRVPIFIGKERYGTLIVNYADKNRKFKHNEIVLCLNITYLIGLGLKINKENESKIDLLQFFDDLQLGVFIIQQNEAGIYRFAYVNSQICKISGYTKEEIYTVPNFTDVVAIKDESFIRSFQSKEFAVKNLPKSFEININVKNGNLPVKISLANGEFNDHYAIYGLVFQSLKENDVSAHYTEIIEKINQKSH